MISIQFKNQFETYAVYVLDLLDKPDCSKTECVWVALQYEHNKGSKCGKDFTDITVHSKPITDIVQSMDNGNSHTRDIFHKIKRIIQENDGVVVLMVFTVLEGVDKDVSEEQARFTYHIALMDNMMGKEHLIKSVKRQVTLEQMIAKTIIRKEADNI